MRNIIWRWATGAALAGIIALTFGGVAWSQDGRYNDDYYNRRDDASERGYRNGYRDGYQRGQSDADRGRHFKFKNDDWEDSRGYEHWMGGKGRYKHEYREGYERGYRAAYNSFGYRRDRDRDDWR
ncbi:MAG TPA: hypothetical protein VMG82_04190 [Candidatus Sulfotelmatobacter sp.]|nr:hypothetical protein [Candidatus Sulfotelmatobacter sp.]